MDERRSRAVPLASVAALDLGCRATLARYFDQLLRAFLPTVRRAGTTMV
jgi:hypothetical protein